MDIKISLKFAIIILGIGVFSTMLFTFDKSFPIEYANAQMNMEGGQDGGHRYERWWLFWNGEKVAVTV